MIYRFRNFVFILTILLVADRSFGQEGEASKEFYELEPFSVDTVGWYESQVDIIKSIDELAKRLDRIEQLLKENNEGSSGAGTARKKSATNAISLNGEHEFKLLILNALAGAEGLNKKGTSIRHVEAFLGSPDVKESSSDGSTYWKYQFEGRLGGEAVLHVNSRSKTVTKIVLDDSLILENVTKLASIGAEHGKAPAKIYDQKWLNINNWRKIVPSKTKRNEVIDLIGQPTYINSNDWYYDGVKVQKAGRIVWYSQEVLIVTEPIFKH